LQSQQKFIIYNQEKSFSINQIHIIMSHEDSDDQLIETISNLIDKVMEENGAIQGISIGTEVATNIYTRLKPKLTQFSESELIATATSFHYISNNLFSQVAQNNLHSTSVSVENHIVLLQIIKDISGAVILDRKLAELEGIKRYQSVINDLLVRIASEVETSEYIKEDPIVKIVKAVPSALFLAIVSKTGLPIKVIDNSDVQEAIVASQVAALSNIAEVMMKSSMDYTILEGEGANVMIVQFDSERILIISIPEKEKSKIGQYLARIKEIIQINEDNSISL
jgi:predicted regulator of Ras-like GTPase activity (Roadblock/LC7/MglB family)